jgi:hypothetical protein
MPKSMAHRLDEVNHSNKKLYDQTFRDAELWAYNVTLVCLVGVPYERVAVGQMHIDVWSELGENWGQVMRQQLPTDVVTIALLKLQFIRLVLRVK